MRLLSVLFFFLILNGLTAQSDPVDYYERFKERAIQDRFFKHHDIEKILSGLKEDQRFQISEIGKSIEGRSINLVRIGTGKRVVLLWSQMHGDETTATMAMMDLFRFFEDRGVDEALKESIMAELSLYFVPMLNPDGAARFDRRNALGVDLNRDALRLQSPESRILKHLVDSLKPEFGFNLHDQSSYYTAGDTKKTATFSFLAPAYNYEREVNPVRLKAMNLIGDLNDYVQQYFPGMVGRYSDAFEPRAFGDNITKWGTSTILVECGGLQGDPEKQNIRKVHFGLFIHAFQSILNNHYQEYRMKDYLAIPNNERNIRDLLLRNVRYDRDGKQYILDLAFMNAEIESEDHNRVFNKARLMDIGDLSTSKAFVEVDVDSLLIRKPAIYPEVLSKDQLEELDLSALRQKGVGVVLLDEDIGMEYLDYPIAVVHDLRHLQWKPQYQSNPSFFLVEPQSQAIKFWVHNGKIIPIK